MNKILKTIIAILLTPFMIMIVIFLIIMDTIGRIGGKPLEDAINKIFE